MFLLLAARAKINASRYFNGAAERANRAHTGVLSGHRLLTKDGKSSTVNSASGKESTTPSALIKRWAT